MCFSQIRTVQEFKQISNYVIKMATENLTVELCSASGLEDTEYIGTSLSVLVKFTFSRHRPNQHMSCSSQITVHDHHSDLRQAFSSTVMHLEDAVTRLIDRLGLIVGTDPMHHTTLSFKSLRTSSLNLI